MTRVQIARDRYAPLDIPYNPIYEIATRESRVALVSSPTSDNAFILAQTFCPSGEYPRSDRVISRASERALWQSGRFSRYVKIRDTQETRETRGVRANLVIRNRVTIVQKCEEKWQRDIVAPTRHIIYVHPVATPR